MVAFPSFSALAGLKTQWPQAQTPVLDLRRTISGTLGLHPGQATCFKRGIVTLEGGRALGALKRLWVLRTRWNFGPTLPQKRL